jgi:hypothetical protein
LSPTDADSPVTENAPAKATTPLATAVEEQEPLTNNGSLIRAGITALILTLFAALLIFSLTAPNNREVYINGEAEVFSIPEDVRMAMPEVEAIHLRGLDLTISRIHVLTVRSEKLRKTVNGVKVISIAHGGRTGPSSSGVLLPLGRKGDLSVTPAPKAKAGTLSGWFV